MTDNEFLEVIQAVCKRPKMYTATGSFFEAVSFLEGFGCGKGVGDKPYHSSLTPFLRWFAGRIKGERQFPLHWVEVRDQFSSDREACEALPVLYQAYLDEAVT